MAASGVRSRKTAARVLGFVARGQSLPAALQAADAGQMAARDRAFVRRLVTGVLRHKRRLLGELHALLERPLKQPFVENLLLIAISELEQAPDSAHAAVHSAVAATPQPQRAFANAILRRYLREGPAFEAQAPARKHSYPDWLANAIAADWPGAEEAVLAAGNSEAPMVLRVNRRRGTAAEYRELLTAAGFTCRPAPGAGLVLDSSAALAELPGFADGRVSVQGLAAQQAVPLLDIQPGQQVLDACAAPGGKTAQMLEQYDPGAVLAVDADGERLTLCRATLQRLGLEAELVAADAADGTDWAGGRRFERILLDAPCTGTGVIRRHPDIKWLRRPGDVARAATLQRRLLESLWGLLAPGGLLLYTTCSILSAENEAVVAAFLGARDDAAAVPVKLPAGEATAHGWRIPPGGPWEGFYYALLRKAG